MHDLKYVSKDKPQASSIRERLFNRRSWIFLNCTFSR